MKALAYITFTILTLSFVQAQKGSVNIEQEEKIEQLLTAYAEAIEKTGYYTIQVGFVRTDEKANHLKSLVNIDFPGLYSRVDFDSPTYRVKVGRFKTKIEAERKFNEVRKKYPQAMLLKPKK